MCENPEYLRELEREETALRSDKLNTQTLFNFVESFQKITVQRNIDTIQLAIKIRKLNVFSKIYLKKTIIIIFKCICLTLVQNCAVLLKKNMKLFTTEISESLFSLKGKSF